MERVPGQPAQPDPTDASRASEADEHLYPAVQNSVFLGRYGLRAGWSLSAGLVLFFVLWSLLLSCIGPAVWGRPPSPATTQSRSQIPSAATSQAAARHAEVSLRETVVAEAVTLAATWLATLAMALLERRRMRVYGINGRTWMNFFPGAFWGLASVSLLVFALRGLHLLIFDGRALQGAAVYAYGGKWLVAFLLVGLFEEYSTRGFLQYTLTRGLMGLGAKIAPQHARAAAFWSAAVVMSVVFGLLHLSNAGETAPGIAMVFLAGLLFSYALWRTGSLWWAIGFHMAWDWAQSFLYGVPDSGQISAGRLFVTHPAGSAWLSGGVDGPEGSVLVLPTLLLVALVIRFTTRSAPQPPLEAEDTVSEPMLRVV
jgi:membrane protease YdiL (CAAX protease family)